MTQQTNLFPSAIESNNWNEELARAKKYKEATQKRRTEKLASKKIETLNKNIASGRLEDRTVSEQTNERIIEEKVLSQSLLFNLVLD